MKNFLLFLALMVSISFIGCSVPVCSVQTNNSTQLPLLQPNGNTQKPNIIFILSDDHRFDFMGFTKKVPWLKTPAMDRLATEGMHFSNTFVTTSLCSPSRASILTGMYTHTHTIVDNNAPEPEGLVYFSQYLQQAGYRTSFFGKWHMGDNNDNPRPGFDHWESFKGQGEYYSNTLNINGEHIKYGKDSYISELLTDHAIDWMDKKESDKPFFVYLSHKAVHAMFEPSPKYDGRYADEKIPYPESFNITKDDTYKKNRIPEWVKEQRYSWHGVDYMYHGKLEFEPFYKRYCETLMGIDDSIATILDYLDKNNMAENTVVIYMSDNGFSFGERGLIDKRHAYEESIKVPLIIRWPGVISQHTTAPQMIQNIDIAPTLIDIAGLNAPSNMQGRSFLPLLKGDKVDNWRDKIFYEYYWEYDFPMTPTVFAVRTSRYKYIRYFGIWDTNEFYDLQEDPGEIHNLIAAPQHQELIRQLADELYDWLQDTNGMQIPLKRTVKHRWGDWKNKDVY